MWGTKWHLEMTGTDQRPHTTCLWLLLLQVDERALPAARFASLITVTIVAAL